MNHSEFITFDNLLRRASLVLTTVVATMVCGLYGFAECNSRYSEATADGIIVQEGRVPQESQRTYYGFDRDGDGQLDLIKEHFRYHDDEGSGVVFPVQNTYHRNHEGFGELEKLFY